MGRKTTWITSLLLKVDNFRMRYHHCIILALATLCFESISHAQHDHAILTDPVTKEHYFVFNSSKGQVHFNHDLHQAEMKTEMCLPCHKTKTPTKAQTMTLFDQRVAHSFCKGCHREMGRGPAECHECHKEQK